MNVTADEWLDMEHVDRVAIMKKCEDTLSVDGFAYNYQSCLRSQVCNLIEGARDTLPPFMKGLPGTDEQTKSSDSQFKYTIHHRYGSKLHSITNNGTVCPFGCTRKLKPHELPHPWYGQSPKRVPVRHRNSSRHDISTTLALDVLRERSLFGLRLGTDFQLTKKSVTSSCVVVSDHALFCDYIKKTFEESGLHSVQPGRITPFFRDRLSASGVVFGHAACPLGLPADQCKHSWRFYEGLDRYAYKDIIVRYHDVVIGVRLFLSRLYQGVYFEADQDIFTITLSDLIAELSDVVDLIYIGERRSPPVLHSTKNKIPRRRQITSTYKLHIDESTISFVSKTGFLQFPSRSVMRRLGWLS